MNISLPEALKEYVRQRVAEDHYSNPSDFIRALIREDQRRQAARNLERLLAEGLESGEAVPVTPEDWRAIRRAVRSSLLDFLRSSPLAEAVAAGEIDLERDRTPIRELDLGEIADETRARPEKQ